jgi:hypothetical protein
VARSTRPRVLALVIHYDRLLFLRRLVSQLQASRGVDVEIVVVDDRTPGFEAPEGVLYAVRMQRHHGKNEFWRTTTVLFEQARRLAFDYALVIQDDMELDGPGALRKLIRVWNAIPDRRKVAINPLNDRIGQPVWNRLPPENVGPGLWRSGWVDGCYLCERKFFEALEYRIFPTYPFRNGSSGVGRQITRRLVERFKTVYQTERAYVLHGDHESKMHRRRRSVDPLISTNRR